ncbi:MAG: UPF0176 protein [Myxococcota bacterium]|jgi:UPF0176 protein
MSPFLVAALYKFVSISDIEELRGRILEACRTNGVNGTILLASEGINGTIAGHPDGIEAVLNFIKSDARFAEIEVKFATAETSPFHRIKVRPKKEIVSMGVEGLDPKQIVGTYVDPHDWNALIQDPDVLVIDTRNDYEVAIGTFKGAKNPGLQSFRAFPDWLREEMKTRDQPKVAMFCTGGIRCEKSTAFLKNEGIEEVFHLKGGILKYLENVPEEESEWEGECFVFDQRVSVTHGLKEGSFTLCWACRNPINKQDRETPEFQDGVSCPHCFSHTTAEQKASFAERIKQINLARDRGTVHIRDDSTVLAPDSAASSD